MIIIIIISKKQLFNIGIITLLISTIFLTQCTVYAAEVKTPYFTDVRGHWIEKVANWGYENNIIKGYAQDLDSEPTFRPNSLISEEEFLAMYLRAMGAKIDSNTEGNWEEPYYIFALAKHYPVFNRTNDNHAIKRDQAANIIVASMGLDFHDQERYLYQPFLYLMDNGYVKGKVKSNDQMIAFSPEDTLTRAEALQMIYNIKQKGGFELKERPVSQFKIPDEKKVYVDINTSVGKFTIELFTQYAPKTVHEFKLLIDRSFYDETSLSSMDEDRNGLVGSTSEMDSYEDLYYETEQSLRDYKNFASHHGPWYYIPEDLGRNQEFNATLGTVYLGYNGLLVIPLISEQADYDKDLQFFTPLGQINEGLENLNKYISKEEEIIINSMVVRSE